MMSLPDSLRATATCNTTTPVEAVTALTQASAAILLAKFNRYEVVHLMTTAFKAALQLAPIDPAEALPMPQEREPGRVSDAELVRYFAKQVIELRGEAADDAIASAMLNAVVALLEDERGIEAAFRRTAEMLDAHRVAVIAAESGSVH